MELIEIITALSTFSVIASAICTDTAAAKNNEVSSKKIYPVGEVLALK